MKKTLIVGVLGLVTLGLSTPVTEGGFLLRRLFCKGANCGRYTTTICMRQYNAFTPVCWGTIMCDGGCPIASRCGPTFWPGCGTCPMPWCGWYPPIAYPGPCCPPAPCCGDGGCASTVAASAGSSATVTDQSSSQEYTAPPPAPLPNVAPTTSSYYYHPGAAMPMAYYPNYAPMYPVMPTAYYPGYYQPGYPMWMNYGRPAMYYPSYPR